MKKIYILTIAFFIIAVILKAQSVQRDKVIVELLSGIGYFTGPGAQMGGEDLISNGKNVAVITYCNSTAANDTVFPNVYSKWRCAYYLPSAWVSARFDGLGYACCGHPTQSQYSVYLPIYNTKYAIPSDFTIQLTTTHTGLNYNAHVVVNNVNSNTNKNLKLILALTQSNIAFNWQGINHLSFIERLMMPNEWGSAIVFCSGNTATFDLPFTIKASWPVADLQLVAFIQDLGTYEIFQGTKLSLSDDKETENNIYNLKVYSHEIKNVFTIAFDLKETSEVTVAINDIIGKNVFTKEINTAIPGVNSFEFDASNLTPGNYLIKLSVNGVCTTKKLSIS